MYLVNGVGAAPLMLDAVLRLKKDFGVYTVMLLRKPLLTEKTEPRWLRAAEAESITEATSEPSL